MEDIQQGNGQVDARVIHIKVGTKTWTMSATEAAEFIAHAYSDHKYAAADCAHFARTGESLPGKRG